MKTIKILTFIGMTIATIAICVYMFQFAQLANERARCKAPDQLSRIDYQFCISQGLI